MPFFTGDVYWEGPVKEFSGTELSTGEKAEIFRMKSESIQVTFSEFGASLVSLKFAGKEMTLNYSTLAELEKNTTYYGATIGRFANRIKDGTFTLDNEMYALPKNNDKHFLHGGPRGWSHRVWKGEEIAPNTIEFVLEDNDEYFQSKVIARTIYQLENAQLNMHWECMLAPGETRSTIVNMTNHTYWNLTGDLFMKIHCHGLFLNCDRYLDIDEEGIPTGKIETVLPGTIEDFHSCPRILRNGEYDHCFLRNPDQKFIYAELNSEQHNTRVQISADHPAIQIYTANFLPADDQAAPHDYQRAICLEPQHCPDSPNHQANGFPPGFILRPNQPHYQHKASFLFSHFRTGPRAHCYCRICGRDWG